MIDYSFIRLSDSLAKSQDLGDSPTVTHYSLETIQLLPNRAYLQITNVEGGISLDSDCEVFVIDCSGNVLADITDNVFIEEFTDNNGNNQCSIEYVNLGVDFYRQTVQIKFDMLSSDAVYFSNPLNITAYQSNQTVFFKYKNDDDFYGIGYTNANKWQSISLRMYFDIPIDETETENYFQISTNNTVSTRALVKLFERYQIEKTSRFVFDRLNILLKHELIYLDSVRVTNKPVVASEDRLGDSNYFETNFNVAKDYNDTSLYDYQIFDGLEIVSRTPDGLYSLTSYVNDLSVTFNYPITIGEGTLRIYDSTDDTLLAYYTENDLSLTDSRTFTILSFEDEITTIGNYYIQFDEGLISALGIDYPAINDTTSWTFQIAAGRYDETRYDSTDYLTGAPALSSFLSLYYKFNETSGTTATDDSGNGLDGTITNATINETGLVDKCYLFNDGGALNHYVDVADNDLLSFVGATTDTSFSISIWIYPQNNFGAILNKYSVTDGYEYRMFMQSGILQFYIYSENSSYNRIGIADDTVVLNQWNHIVVTWDGVTMQMKVNNNDASFAQTEFGTYVKMSNTDAILRLGQESDADSGSNRFVGNMDILKIYKGYVLTDNEIETEYNSGNGTES